LERNVQTTEKYFSAIFLSLTRKGRKVAEFIVVRVARNPNVKRVLFEVFSCNYVEES
jgi:hypothetical protein